MPKENVEQRGQRLSLYQSYVESGQTIAEFARERGSTAWRVKWAVRKTEAEQKQNGNGFSEVATMPTGSFGVGGGEYSVTLRNGRELRVPAHFVEKRVRQLIGILETC